MAILMYDYCELEERAGKHLRVWKAWHIVIFILTAIFGMLNYLFLRNTMYMVGDRCVLGAPVLAFEMVSVYVPNGDGTSSNTTINTNETEVAASEAQTTTTSVPSISTTYNRTKREANFSRIDPDNLTISGHTEKREVLDLLKTYFASSRDCEFEEYMPIVSTIFALVWTTMFTMCPSGGHARSGLSQPWRILAPALPFALVLVGLTGHSFTQTNRGLREFCSAFYNYTNATTCSSVNIYLERSWNATWKFSARTEATRAASAAVWVCWAGAATLLVVRCLAAPDFQLRKTGVYLTSDPEQKVTPYLRNSRRRPGAFLSPNKSARSEPTATTELVTASVEDSSITDSSLLAERDSSV